MKKGVLMCMYCTTPPGVIGCACCGADDAKKCDRYTWSLEVEGIGYCKECCDEQGEDATKCTRCYSKQNSKKCSQCDTLHCEDCFDAECGVFCEHVITFCGECSLCSESSGAARRTTWAAAAAKALGPTATAAMNTDRQLSY